MKVYIIGKVTGLNYEEACSLFNEREQKLEAAGHEVVNPVRLVPEDTNWRDAMRVCIGELVQCEAVSLLDNAAFSWGASLEMIIAGELGIEKLN